MEKSKPWWKSRTVWLAIIAIALTTLTQLQNLISSGQAVTVMAVLMILMRAITSQKIVIIK